MKPVRPSLAILFVFLLLLSAASAQTTTPNDQVPAPIVTATASHERVRYVSMGEVRQTRLQVFSNAGVQVFDSDFKLGNLIDWQLGAGQTAHLAPGSYLYLITVKDFSDHITQKYGVAVLEQNQVYLEQRGRDELPRLQAAALEANKQAEALSMVDRIGVAASNSAASGLSKEGTDKSSITTEGGETIAGTGTLNRVSKWVDSAGTLGDSAITEIGGKVGIGITNPSYKLVVGPDIGSGLVAADLTISRGAGQSVSAYVGASGTRGMEFGWDAAGSRAFLNAPANTPISFLQGGPERMRISADGKVGIGTTDPTQGRLTVYEASDTGTAVHATGYNFGVYGVSDSNTGSGVFGVGGNLGAGVWGYSTSSNGIGVYGLNAAHGLAGLFEPLIKISVGINNTGQVQLGNMGCSGAFGGISFAAPSGCANYSMVGDGTDTMINRTAGGTIYFREANANQMAILPGGRVGIGTLTPDQLLTVNGVASKPGGGSWATFSDERLKTINGRFTAGLKALMRLQPVRYRYRTNNALGIKPDGEHVGFNAQEIESIVPEAVSKDDKGFLLVNNDPIMWTMLNAIKEQQKLILQLQQQMARQQSKLLRQQAQLNQVRRTFKRKHTANR